MTAPTPTDIRAARQAAGLSQTAAGALCHRSLRAWQAVEAGDRALDPAAWELFLLRTGQHPTHRLIERYASPADSCATRVSCGAGSSGVGSLRGQR